MNFQQYFYNCSKEYIEYIETNLVIEVIDVINKLPKRQTQAEINNDLVWLFSKKGWAFDKLPSSLTDYPPSDLKVLELSKDTLKSNNNRTLCETSTTLGARWFADFAKVSNNGLIQLEAQFGTVESMFKDFCGFKIAHFERRLALGIEVVLCEPNNYFAHRKSSVAGMAYFDIAKKTLPVIGLDCPIWLIGLKE